MLTSFLHKCDSFRHRAIANCQPGAGSHFQPPTGGRRIRWGGGAAIQKQKNGDPVTKSPQFCMRAN